MKRHTTQLIEGCFNRHNAKDLLLALLNHKIQYHERQLFSDVIRLGKEGENSEKRIQELEREKKDLIQWMQTMESTDMIDIHCTIELRAR